MLSAPPNMTQLLAQLTTRKVTGDYEVVGPAFQNSFSWWADFYSKEHTLEYWFDEMVENSTYAIKVPFDT